MREYKRRYREKNREKVRASARRERAEHPERVRARQQRYIENDKEQYLLLSRKHCHLRYARKKSAQGSFTEDDIALLKSRQRGKCYWCKQAYGKSFQIDHVWPIARGGSNGPENLCIACKTCNLKKNDKTPIEWAGRLL